MNSCDHPDRRPDRADRDRRLPAAHRSDLRCAGRLSIAACEARETDRPRARRRRDRRRRCRAAQPRPACRQSRPRRPGFSQARRARADDDGRRQAARGNAEGLAPWAATELTGKDGRSLTITATPARHGPAGIEPMAGDVIGFVLTSKDDGRAPVYISGDTVWYDGVAEVARRFRAAWCCRSPARRRPAGRSISPWTPTTPSKPRAPFRMP